MTTLTPGFRRLRGLPTQTIFISDQRRELIADDCTQHLKAIEGLSTAIVHNLAKRFISYKCEVHHTKDSLESAKNSIKELITNLKLALKEINRHWRGTTFSRKGRIVIDDKAIHPAAKRLLRSFRKLSNTHNAEYLLGDIGRDLDAFAQLSHVLRASESRSLLRFHSGLIEVTAKLGMMNARLSVPPQTKEQAAGRIVGLDELEGEGRPGSGAE